MSEQTTTTTTFGVTGMTCGNCVRHVTEELEAIDAVKSVSIELVTDGASQVTVVSDDEIPTDTLRSAIDEAGYSLVV